MDFNIQEEGDFGNKVPSLKEIALIHIRKISDICCNEFTPGRWEEKPIKVGGGIAITKKYIPDQRAVFCNAVDFLLWLVYPYADETFKGNHKVKEHKSDITEKDWEKKIEQRQKLFIDLMIMFENTNFFDVRSGQKE